MTRLQFKKLKENDVIFDSDEYYIVTGWYNNQLVELKELIYNDEKEDFDISSNELRCCYIDLEKSVIVKERS